MSKLISLLVPVYKIPEALLRKCILSLVSQSLVDIEIILVDDGSPDNCGAICDEYAALDQRIKVIHKTNGGLSAARNSAFDAATGDYVMFVDGDDYLDVRTCELTYQTAIEQKADVVMFDQTTEYSKTSVVVHSFPKGPLSFKDDQCKDLQLRVLNFNGKIAMVFCKLIRRSLLKNFNIRHIDYLKQGAEGFVFNIALFEHCTSAYYYSNPLYHYIYNEQSISHSSNESNYYYIVNCFQYISDFIRSSVNYQQLQRYLYNRLLYVIVTTGITGYFNPDNTANYKQRVEGYKKFLQEPIICYALYHADYFDLSVQRRFILQMVKWKQFWVINILGKLRRRQLHNY